MNEKGKTQSSYLEGEHLPHFRSLSGREYEEVYTSEDVSDKKELPGKYPFTRGIHKNWKALDNITIKETPDNIYLKNSKFYPINTGNPGIAAQAMLNPQKYGVDHVPEMMILHMAQQPKIC